MGDQQDFEKGKGMFFIFTRACVRATNVSVDMPEAVFITVCTYKRKWQLLIELNVYARIIRLSKI